MHIPPGVLGIIDDAFFRYVTDVGVVGPDKGQGGKYLLVPPGYSGSVPTEGYFVQKPRTYTNLFILRAFVKNGDLAGTVKNFKDHARVYRLADAANPPAQKFVDISKLKINTVHANDFHFYEELNEVVQHEPADFIDPETVGLFASIGIKKGQKFAPDARMKAILIDAVAVGNATARAITFAPRDERTKFYPDRQWYTTFYAGGYAFEEHGERMLDTRAMFHYYATGITPAMTNSKPGTGLDLRHRGPGCAGQLLRRRQDVQGHAARADPGRQLLVLHRLRQPAPLAARDRPEARRPRQHFAQPEEERRRLGHRVLRAQGARGPGGQLGADRSGQGLERPAAAVRAAGALVRQELEAGGLRGREVGESKEKAHEEHDDSAARSGRAGRRDRCLASAPAQDTTPDSVKTRIGDLKFERGYPTEETEAEALRRDRLPARRAVLPVGVSGGVVRVHPDRQSSVRPRSTTIWASPTS